jgi:histidinol-phosphatase (PHP family)
MNDRGACGKERGATGDPGAQRGIVDLHTHHRRCGHAQGDLRDVVGWALARGIGVLGLSDHAPRFADRADHPRPLTQMARSDWDAYLAEGVALQHEYRARIDIRVGVEADFLPGTEAHYRPPLSRPELDFVLGSVHEVMHPAGVWNMFDPSSYAGFDLDAVHRGYWEAVAAAAAANLFDVLAHLDLVRRLPAPINPPTLEAAAALDAIAAHGVAVEINGSGLRRDGRPYPDRDILAGLVARGVPISFGSDAHAPHHLGMGWQEGIALLHRLGVKRLATFRQRALTWVEID